MSIVIKRKVRSYICVISHILQQRSDNMEELLSEEKTERPILTGIQKADDAEELHNGRIYIMDRRSPVTDRPEASRNTQTAPNATDETKENDHADTSPDTVSDESPHAVSFTRTAQIQHEGRFAYCVLLALLGCITGVVIALVFPLPDISFLGSAIYAENGFSKILLQRLGQCGGFLLAAYLLGYFAAGGVIVWLTPFIYGMGVGLSCAGGIAEGGSPAVILPCTVCLALITAASCTSWEFSSVLLRLISGRSGSVITRGSATYSYNLRFGVYLLILLALSITEAAARTAFTAQ